jgi:plasmid stabilization system protein ParE
LMITGMMSYRWSSKSRRERESGERCIEEREKESARERERKSNG